MNQARRISEGVLTPQSALNVAMGDWVAGLGPWQLFGTFTFAWEASIDSARRLFVRWVQRKEGPWRRGVSYFYAIEQNPCRDGFHIHTLWMDCFGVVRRHEWRDWFDRYGRNNISVVKNKDDVADYVAKYVTKRTAWWDLRMQSHRMPDFSLFALAKGDGV